MRTGRPPSRLVDDPESEHLPTTLPAGQVSHRQFHTSTALQLHKALDGGVELERRTEPRGRLGVHLVLRGVEKAGHKGRQLLERAGTHAGMGERGEKLLTVALG